MCHTTLDSQHYRIAGIAHNMASVKVCTDPECFEKRHTLGLAWPVGDLVTRHI